MTQHTLPSYKNKPVCPTSVPYFYILSLIVYAFHIQSLLQFRNNHRTLKIPHPNCTHPVDEVFLRLSMNPAAQISKQKTVI